jgi:hypothetical protein
MLNISNQICEQLSLHNAQGFQAVQRLRWSVASLPTEVVKVSNQVSHGRFVVVLAEL